MLHFDGIIQIPHHVNYVGISVALRITSKIRSCSDNERLNCWSKCVQKLLNNVAPGGMLAKLPCYLNPGESVSDAEPRIMEIKAAISQLKGGKVAGSNKV